MIQSPETKSRTGSIVGTAPSSLEDRHFLSEPRPVPDLDLPTWEVDVHREGVEQPILTLRVDAKVLPPRKKKKKILWKLPDSVEKLPKFGEQDKKRILELFREKKKELKKLKNKQRAYRRASSMEAMSSGGKAAVAAAAAVAVGDGMARGNGRGNDTPPPKATAAEVRNHLPPENGNHNPGDPSLSPPGFEKLSISDPEHESPTTNTTISSSTTTSLPPPPPGMPASSPLTHAPPPGLPPSNHPTPPPLNGQHHPPQNPPAQAPSGLPPPQTNGHHPSQQSPLSSALPPGLTNGFHPPMHEVAPPLPPKAIGPCFVLPPDAPPGASLGKFVTETYYLLLRNGLIRDLDAYYYKCCNSNGFGPCGSNGGVSNGNGKLDDASDWCFKVHKALTVGAANAVCETQEDRLVQLNTFAGCEMRIKGVQEQPTVGDGLLVVITGVNLRSAPPAGPAAPPATQQLPFCHTLILAPVATTTAASLASAASLSAATKPTIGYQIRNDNLVILTGDE